MNHTLRLSCLFVSLSFIVLTGRGEGAEILVDTSTGFGQVGGFYGLYDPFVDDPPGDFPPTLDPDNVPSFQNYFMGRSTFGPLSTSLTSPERRAFFMFDMMGVLASIPVGHTISEVTIDLELTEGGSAALANFTGGLEIVSLSGTPFGAAEIVDPMGTMTSSVDIWSSFGSSTPYGTFEIEGSAGAMTTVPGIYSIPLPGSIADLEAAIAGGGVFIVTGKLATFDPDVIGPDAPPAVDPYEYVFGITDVVASGGGSSTPAPVLTITTVPEPGAVGLLLLVLVVAGLRRKSRRF